MERVLIGEDWKARDDLAEFLAACLLRKSIRLQLALPASEKSYRI